MRVSGVGRRSVSVTAVIAIPLLALTWYGVAASGSSGPDVQDALPAAVVKALHRDGVIVKPADQASDAAKQAFKGSLTATEAISLARGSLPMPTHDAATPTVARVVVTVPGFGDRDPHASAPPSDAVDHHIIKRPLLAIAFPDASIPIMGPMDYDGPATYKATLVEFLTPGNGHFVYATTV